METELQDTAVSKTSIRPAVKKTEVRPTPFVETKFTMAQLSELLGIAKTSLYNLEREGFICGTVVTYGSSERKVYSWDEFAKLANRFREKLERKFRRKVQVFANLKGGVGKSTIATQIAMLAAAWGLKVLVIDLDAQANTTTGIGGLELARTDGLTIRDILIEKKPLKEVIRNFTPLLSLIPSNLSLSALDRKLQAENNRERKLKNFLDDIKKDWDLIIIDTSPSASLANVNAFVAADEICIVSATEYLSVSGLTSFFELLEDLQADFGIEPAVRIVANLFDVRNGMDQESLGLLRRDWSEFLTHSVVRKNVDLREAHKLRQPIWLYKKSSPAAEDLNLLGKELLFDEVPPQEIHIQSN